MSSRGCEPHRTDLRRAMTLLGGELGPFYVRLPPGRRERFLESLRAAGMPDPRFDFSVAEIAQVLPGALLADIETFIAAFDRVTRREAWCAAALREAPPIAAARRPEVCFFSAWDFHLPPQGTAQLIEFNDNGSGLLFAGLVNAAFFEAAGPGAGNGFVPPPEIGTFRTTVAGLIEREAAAFFGAPLLDSIVIVDDDNSLRRGRFRQELAMLRDLLSACGHAAGIARAVELVRDERKLLFEGRPVAFVINRSTDFFWRSDEFAALRDVYAAESVYIAPNPHSYATRSDKRLLEWLSSPIHDAELGITEEERRILDAHVPETHVLRPENAEALAQAKQDFVFKPAHGYASRGLLNSADVGRQRLSHLARSGEGYVAQRRVAKSSVSLGGHRLWTDLRVWAHRGAIVALSGRASKRPDRIDLTSPGGWTPTFPLQ